MLPLFALSLLTLASAFLDRKGGLHLFSLPELRSPLGRHLSATGAGYRHLREINGQYPEVHDTHEFIGSTPFGFVVLNSSTIVRNTTVSSDDYFALFSTATFACTVSDGTAAMTIDFPHGVSDAVGFEHLSARLANPFAVLTLGVDTLLKHPSFKEEGSCVRAFPEANPYFYVSRATRTDSKLTLDVTPASPRDAFAFLSVNLQHSPDTSAEVARRKAAGLYIGRDLSATNPANYVGPTQYWVNWNGETGSNAGARPTTPLPNSGVAFPATATSTLNGVAAYTVSSATPYASSTAASMVSVNTFKLPFFPPTGTTPATTPYTSTTGTPLPNYDLFCQSCYWYTTATLNVQLQICALVNSPQASLGTTSTNTYTSYFDASLPLSQPNNGFYYINSGYKGLPGQVVTSDADAKSKTDCASLGTSNTQTVVNAGISASVWLEGPAYFNFVVKSEGLAATTLPEYSQDPLRDLANLQANYPSATTTNLISTTKTTTGTAKHLCISAITADVLTTCECTVTSGVTYYPCSTTAPNYKSVALPKNDCNPGPSTLCTPLPLPNLIGTPIPSTTSTVTTPLISVPNPQNKMPQITFMVGINLPITIDTTTSLHASAIISGSPGTTTSGFSPNSNFQFQVGTAGTVAMKLGGTMTISDYNLGSPSITPAYNTYTTTYTPSAFTLTGLINSPGVIDATLSPRIDISIWKSSSTNGVGGGLPFTITPKLNFKTSLTLSSSTCPAGQVAYTTSTAGSLGVTFNNPPLPPLTSTSTSLNTIVSAASAAYKEKYFTGLAIGTPLLSLLTTATGAKLWDSTNGVPDSSEFTSLLSTFSYGSTEFLRTTVIVDPNINSFSTYGALTSSSTGCAAVGSSVNTGGSTNPSGTNPSPSATATATASSSTSATSTASATTTATTTASVTPSPSPVLLPPLNVFLNYSSSPSNTAATITLYASISAAVGQLNPLTSIRNSLLQNFIGAPLGALVFAALLYYTALPTTAPGTGLACCCRLHSGGAKGGPDDTTPWSEGGAAVASKWIAWGATSFFLLGWSLLVTSFDLPWAPFSPTLTLPLLAAATTCDPSTTSKLAAGSPGDILCQGGTQLSIGQGFLAAATAMGGCAWGIAWIVTIRLRNVAHHSSLPASTFFLGTLPPAVVLGWGASVCGLVGVVLTWVGYYGVSSLFPPALPSRPPPGGIAALVGLVALVVACLALGEVFNVLPSPIPNITGSTAYSLCPLRAPKRDVASSSSSGSSRMEEGGGGSPRTSPSSSPTSALALRPGIWQQQQSQQLQLQRPSYPNPPYPGVGAAVTVPPAYPQILPPSPSASASPRPGERLDARLMNMYFPQTVLGTQAPPPAPSLPSPSLSSSSSASVEEAFNVVRAAEMLRKSQQMEAAASEAALVEARSALGSAIAREEAEEEDRRRWEQFEDAAAAAAIETARKMRRSSQGAAAQRAAEVTNLLRSLPISAFRMLREKGAITLNGDVMKPAMLTYQEEELIGNSELLLKLVEHGIILPSY